MTPREIDWMVGQTVFSQFPHTAPGSIGLYPGYSEHAVHAHEVIDKMLADGYHFACSNQLNTEDGPWWAEFVNATNDQGGQASGSEFARVVCEAALMARGIMVPV